MPRRYNDAIHKDSVGALLQQQQRPPVGNSGTHDQRRRKAGGAPKNYCLDNRANIKEMQAQNRQRREEEAAPAAEPFKLQQFKNVKSRFAAAAAAAAAAGGRGGEGAPAMAPWSAPGATPAAAPGASKEQRTPESSEGQTALARDFLRKGTRAKLASNLRQEALRRRQEEGSADNAALTTKGSKLFGSTGVKKYKPPIDSQRSCSPPAKEDSRGEGSGGGRRSPSGSGAAFPGAEAETSGRWADTCGRGGAGVTPRKEAVPRAKDVARLAPRSGRNFVAANRLQAMEMKARDVSGGDKAFTHESYGRVPDYLVSRQQEWEVEADRRKAEAPDPSCPPGMKLMPEDERLETLRQLQENEAACQSQLNAFPLVVQTPLLQRRVDDLNNKLNEIESAKAMFSRPRVYIARDS